LKRGPVGCEFERLNRLGDDHGRVVINEDVVRAATLETDDNSILWSLRDILRNIAGHLDVLDGQVFLAELVFSLLGGVGGVREQESSWFFE
jgi:hypothetical protein